MILSLFAVVLLAVMVVFIFGVVLDLPGKSRNAAKARALELAAARGGQSRSR